jgi:integrase
VKNIVAALRALIGFADLRGWIQVNPCDGLRLPAGEQARERIASPAEAASLIAALRPDDRLALGLAVYAGLRLGELLALELSAIDSENGWIHVRRSWDPGAKEFIPTKSRKARKVPIIDRLAALAADHLVLLNHPTGGLVFQAPTTKTGRPTPRSCAAVPTSAGTMPNCNDWDSMRAATPSQASPSRPG